MLGVVLAVLMVSCCCREAGLAGLVRAGCSAGEVAAALAGAGLLVAAGVVCVQGVLVAHDDEAGEPECERAQAGEADPAAVDAVDGGVFDGGVESFGGGAPPVGELPGL
jgi:hypothetical protein